MEQVINLTEQEIQQISQIQIQQDEFVARFGQLEYQLQNLELQKEKIIEQLETSKTSESQIADQLQEKYGDGVINIKEGTFSKSQ